MKYSLEFLCWVHRCAFFPEDFERNLIALGADKGIAFFMVHSEAFKNRNLIKLYQDYGLKESETKDALDRYFAMMYEKWENYKK